MRLFADPLIRGVIDARVEIDAAIEKHVRNWSLDRMAAVDRNVLRLAVYEMLHRDDIPPVVSINEAVDIAKKFSTHDSGKFVNGIRNSSVRKGYLCLESEGSEIHFRNIRIMELPPGVTTAAQTAPIIK